MKGRLLRLTLIGAALAFARVACADPRDEMARTARFHALLEITQSADKPGQVLERCDLRAIVRRAFGGPLQVGTNLHIAVGCSRTPVPDEGVGPFPDNLSAVDFRYLGAGSLIEAYLVPVPSGGGLPADSFTIPRLLAVPSLSDRPRDVLPPAGVPQPPLGWPRRPQPPNFAERDVVVTYRVSNRPGATFRASYSSGDRPWPMLRVEALGPAAPPAGVVIYSIETPATIRVWDSRQGTEIVKPTTADRAGRLTVNPDAFFTPEGADTVAGVPCTRWRIEDLLRRQPPEQACVTADGVILRRAGAGSTMEALTVEFGPRERARFEPMIPTYFRERPAPGQ